jgi:hypothetical protein
MIHPVSTTCRSAKTALLNYLHCTAPLSEPLRHWLTDCIRERRLARHEHLLRAGEVSNAICFITKACCALIPSRPAAPIPPYGL